MNIDGVEFLATEQVAVEFGMNWSLFFGVGGVIALFIAVVFWISVCECEIGPGAFIFSAIVGLMCGAFFGAVVGRSNENAVPLSYETHYQVTISDDVNLNEFLEYYEIIGQNGKIYTVREKN